MAYQHYEMSPNSQAPRNYDSGLQVVREAGLDKQAIHYQQTSYNYHPSNLKDAEMNRPLPKPTIFGLRRVTFMFTCILGFFFFVIVLMASLFGSKIANLESASKTTGISPTALLSGPVATTTSVAVTGWTFQGCYNDFSARVLSDSQSNADSMTNRACSSFCANSDYFGTENGNQCYCGTNPKLEAVPPWNCNTHCGGASTTPEICGGFFFMSVWKKNGTA